MEYNLEIFITSMIEEFRQMNNRFDWMKKRIENHRGIHQVHTQPDLPRPLSLSTQPYAPTFNGNLDPEVYIDWKKRLDQCFEWDYMIELRKVKFAKLKLVRHTRIY